MSYPLIVAVELDAEDVLAPYRRARFNGGLVGSALTLAILLVGGFLVVQNRRLLRSRQVLADAMDNISQGVMLIDARRRIPLINRRAIELLDLAPGTLGTLPSFDTLTRSRIERRVFGQIAGDGDVPLASDDLDPFLLKTGSHEQTLPDGRVLSVRTRLLADGGAVRTLADITERKRAEASIRHMAHHDSLTGLANRSLATDRLVMALRCAKRDRGSLAVLALDLDHFKAVNDTFGHATGDLLLQQVARRLTGALRETDTLARVGGDEFIVLQTLVRQPASAGILARRLIELLEEPFTVCGHQVKIGTSVGIAIHPSDGDEPTALLRHADLALYRAKSDRSAGPVFFRPDMESRLRRQRALRDDLQRAIGTDQLRLEYQPIFACRTGQITGFETLLRWEHPTRGNVPPASFIAIAEETGLIQPIGRWVLEQACFAAATWPEPKRVAVNLSAGQLRGRGVVSQVADVLRRSGLAPGRLELEVTETQLIENAGTVSETLRALRAMGVHIACDDFGTGYSSFTYLQSFAFNRIKIDKSFVREIQPASTAWRIVQAMLAMAKSLDLDVTVEGVETGVQLALLRQQHYGDVQGFLLGKPMPGEDVAQHLRAQRGRTVLEDVAD